ncbi:MAG: hypothetical protein EPN82_04535 [Bacteroidetes bacterium]|nr:MAG: hypothetical protein EPN82_04535 [Bacteroidota bacterium]
MKSRIFVAVILLLLSAGVIYAQVAIYPPAVFIDAKTRSGSMTVLNQGDDPKEIDIEPKFGYMAYDSNGNVFTQYKDSVAESSNSVIPYLTIFPKKFVLQPKKDQVIRFLIKNIGKIPDGMYYTRIATTSKDVQKQIDTTNLGDKVKIGLSFKFVFMTVLFFEKGSLNTKVDITSLTTGTDSTHIRLNFSFVRDGNAPFLGTAKLKITNSEGDEVENREDKIPLYFSATRAFPVSKDKLKPGKYKAELTLTSDQPDIPDEMRVPFEQVTKTFDFVVE